MRRRFDSAYPHQVNFFLALGLVILIPVAIASVIGAPPVWVPKRAARIMIREAGLKSGEVGYDLGAGIGRLVAIGRKEFDADVRGVEYVPILWWIGKLNLLIQKISPSFLEPGNFYKMDFKSTNVFFCFLMPKTLARLKSKWEREAKPGMRVVTYAMEIPGWTPIRTVKEEKLGRIYVYEPIKKNHLNHG